MSNLHTCTSTTRPSNPEQGDMLFETDSDKLILYYNGAWMTFGASAQAASTVLNIDIGVGIESDIDTYFTTRYAGDWFVNTSLSTRDVLSIKSNTGIYKHNATDFDLSLDLFQQQQTIGQAIIGISSSGAVSLSTNDVAARAMVITPRGDLVIPNHSIKQYDFNFVKTPRHVKETFNKSQRNNITMHSDTSSVTLNTAFESGTLVLTQYNQTETHVGFAGDTQFYGSKDIPTGTLHIDDSVYADLPGPKSFIAKIFRDTQNDPVSASELNVYNIVGMENNQMNEVHTIWFKLSATDPQIETGEVRFIYGLPNHTVFCANSASDGSGWYLGSQAILAEDIPEVTETKLQEDEWYNLTVSISGEPGDLPTGANRDARIYLNGDLVHATTTTRTTYIRTIGNDGAARNHTTNTDDKQECFNGLLTGFAVWKTTLTEQQIDLIANTTNLKSLYRTVPEPYIHLHPVLDPIRLFGVATTRDGAIGELILYNQIPTGVGANVYPYAASKRQYKYYTVDRAESNPTFPQEAQLYSEDHPSK